MLGVPSSLVRLPFLGGLFVWLLVSVFLRFRLVSLVLALRLRPLLLLAVGRGGLLLSLVVAQLVRLVDGFFSRLFRLRVVRCIGSLVGVVIPCRLLWSCLAGVRVRHGRVGSISGSVVPIAYLCSIGTSFGGWLGCGSATLSFYEGVLWLLVRFFRWVRVLRRRVGLVLGVVVPVLCLSQFCQSWLCFFVRFRLERVCRCRPRCFGVRPAVIPLLRIRLIACVSSGGCSWCGWVRWIYLSLGVWKCCPQNSTTPSFLLNLCLKMFTFLLTYSPSLVYNL